MVTIISVTFPQRIVYRIYLSFILVLVFMTVAANRYILITKTVLFIRQYFGKNNGYHCTLVIDGKWELE